jgi:hypothetical protein
MTVEVDNDMTFEVKNLIADQSRRDAMRRLVGRAWADPEFMEQLRRNPKRYLAEAGLLEANIVEDHTRTVRIVENPADAKDPLDFILPARPSFGDELTEDQLDRALERMDPTASNTPMTTCCCDITVAPSVFD